jgi:dTDP-4-amino-4,6-dideoxygalactose transaminase
MTVDAQVDRTAAIGAKSGLGWPRAPRARYRIYSTLGQYAGFASAILRGDFAPGAANAALERRLEDLLDVPHAVTVNQARVGLYLAMRAILTPERPRVVMSPYTIYDVVNMVLAAGGEPVFADIDPNSCNVDPQEVVKLIDDCTGAVLITHLHGLSSEIEPIEQACRSRGIPLVEDCAQCFGVKRHGRYLGTYGDIGVYSFGLFKTINSFFGGVVVAKDARVAARIRELQADFATLNRKRAVKRLLQGLMFEVASFPPVFKTLTFWLFRSAVLAGNEQVLKVTHSENAPVLRRELPAAYRQQMSNIQAQMIFDRLDDIERDQNARVRIATIYHNALHGRRGIVMPKEPPGDSNGCVVYPIQVENRNEVLKQLMRLGRDCAPQHLHNCADLDIFKPWYRDCPRARATADRVILLPCYPRYGENEACRNVAVLDRLFPA